MLVLVSYMNILIEWKYHIYPDSVLNVLHNTLDRIDLDCASIEKESVVI
jgi:hypothetical protein